MAQANFSIEELLADLEKVESPEGWSTLELVEMTKHSVKWVLEKLIRTGVFVFSGNRKGTTINGKVKWTPVYVLAKDYKRKEVKSHV